MQLYTSPTSPYARKVRMVVLETGLADRVEEIVVNPFDDPPDLAAANPLGKVPVLVLPDGEVLFDSTVICAFLDSLAPGPRLVPDPPEGWRVLRQQALGNGMMDALFALVIERRRPAAERSLSWQVRWRSAFLRAADMLEDDPGVFDRDLTLAQITFGAALGYADFRTPDIDWRADRPRLADGFARFVLRPSMQATHPVG